jgi:hypothetical protein
VSTNDGSDPSIWDHHAGRAAFLNRIFPVGSRRTSIFLVILSRAVHHTHDRHWRTAKGGFGCRDFGVSHNMENTMAKRSWRCVLGERTTFSASACQTNRLLG